MRRYLLLTAKVFSYVVLTLVGIIALLVTIINFFNFNSYVDEITQLAKENNVRIETDFSLDLSILLLSHFAIDNLVIYESPDENSSVFIKLKNVYFSFHPLDLLFGEVNIEKIQVNSLQITNHNYPDGTNSISRFVSALGSSNQSIQQEDTQPKISDEPSKPDDVSADLKSDQDQAALVQDKTTDSAISLPKISFKLQELALLDLAFIDISSDNQFEISNVSFQAKDISLEHQNNLSTSVFLSIKEADKTIVELDTDIAIDFLIDRIKNQIDINSLQINSKATHGHFKKLPIKLSVAASYNLSKSFANLKSLKLETGDFLTFNADGKIDLNQESMNGDINISLVSPDLKPPLEKLDLNFLQNSLPLDLKIKASMEGEKYTIQEFKLQAQKTELLSKKISFMNDDSGIFEITAGLKSDSLRELLSTFGVQVLDNPKLDLDLTLNGALSTQEVDLDLNGYLNDLSYSLTGDVINTNSVDEFDIIAKLNISSPDIVQEMRVFTEVAYPTIVPLDITLDISADVKGDRAIVNHINFDLNDNFNISIDGIVEQFDDPSFDVNFHSRFESFRRMLTIFAPELVFPPNSIENIDFGFHASGNANQIDMNQLTFRSPSASFNSAVKINVDPLQIDADLIGQRLYVKNFIPVVDHTKIASFASTKSDKEDAPNIDSNADLPPAFNKFTDPSIDISQKGSPDETDNIPANDGESENTVTEAKDETKWVKIDESGTLVFSDNNLTDLIELPEITVHAKLDWQDISYGEYVVDQLNVNADVSPTGVIDANIDIRSEKMGRIRTNAHLNISDEILTTDIFFNADLDINNHDDLGQFENLPFKLLSKVDLKLRSEGTTIEEQINSLYLKFDFEINRLFLDKTVLPLNLATRANFDMKLKYPYLTLDLTNVEINNTNHPQDQERFHINLKEFSTGLSFEHLYQRKLELQKLVLNGLDARVFTGRNGFLNLDTPQEIAVVDSTTPEQSSASSIASTNLEKNNQQHIENNSSSDEAQSSKPVAIQNEKKDDTSSDAPDTETIEAQVDYLTGLSLLNFNLEDLAVTFVDISEDSAVTSSWEAFRIPSIDVKIEANQPKSINVPIIQLLNFGAEHKAQDQISVLADLDLIINSIHAEPDNTAKVDDIELSLTDLSFLSPQSSINSGINNITLNLTDIEADLKGFDIRLSELSLDTTGLNFQQKHEVSNTLSDSTTDQGLNNQLSAGIENFHFLIKDVSTKGGLNQANIGRIAFSLPQLEFSDSSMDLGANIENFNFGIDAVSANLNSYNASISAITIGIDKLGHHNVTGSQSSLAEQLEISLNDLSHQAIQNKNRDQIEPEYSLGTVKLDSFEILLDAAQFSDPSLLAASIDQLTIKLDDIKSNLNQQESGLGQLSIKIEDTKYAAEPTKQSAGVSDISLLLSDVGFSGSKSNGGIGDLKIGLNNAYFYDQSEDIEVNNDSLKIDLADLIAKFPASKSDYHVSFENFSIKDHLFNLKLGKQQLLDVDQLDIVASAPESINDVQFDINYGLFLANTTEADVNFSISSHLSSQLGYSFKDNTAHLDLIKKTTGSNNQNEQPPLDVVLEMKGELDLEKQQFNDGFISISSEELLNIVLQAEAIDIFDKPFIEGSFHTKTGDLNRILSVAQIAPFEEEISADIDLSYQANLKNMELNLYTDTFRINDMNLLFNIASYENVNMEQTDVVMNLKMSNLRHLIDLVTKHSLVTSRADALNNIEIDGALAFNSQKIDLYHLILSLDGSNGFVKGFRSLENEKTKITAVLSDLNLGDYIPKPPPKEDTSPDIQTEPPEELEEEDSTEDSEPIEFSKDPIFDDEILKTIRSLDIEANITLNNFIAMDVTIDKAELNAVLDKGKINLDNLTVVLDEGYLHSKAIVDFEDDVWDYQLDLNTKNLQLNNIITPLAGFPVFTGMIRANNHLSTRGKSVHEIIENLNGNLDVNIIDGSIDGFNIAYFTCLALDYITLNFLSEEKKWEETSYFDNISLTGDINNGELRLYDIYGDLQLIKLMAKADTNIIDNTFKANIYAEIYSQQTKALCDSLESFKGYTLKVDCAGTYYDFQLDTCQADFSTIGSLLYRGLIQGQSKHILSFQSQVESMTDFIRSPAIMMRKKTVTFFEDFGRFLNIYDKLFLPATPPPRIQPN